VTRALADLEHTCGSQLCTDDVSEEPRVQRGSDGMKAQVDVGADVGLCQCQQMVTRTATATAKFAMFPDLHCPNARMHACMHACRTQT